MSNTISLLLGALFGIAPGWALIEIAKSAERNRAKRNDAGKGKEDGRAN